jgi:16S rRNA (adenine1518-N6/adenine1519-N6)-dimethyltransferase
MRAKKSLGQNFLVDGQVSARIVAALAPRPDEVIIEIGPGHGALTEHLVKRAGRVVAVELDRALAPLLRARFAADSNLTVLDALTVDYAGLIAPATTARVVANLPYYISTAVLQKLLAQRNCLTEMVLMLQREVVGRITAQAGERERGYLSVLVEACAAADLLFDVPPHAFRPVPKVWSSVVRLRPRPHEALAGCEAGLLWQIVSAGFAQRRKTINNNLKAAPDGLRSQIEAAGGVAQLWTRAGVGPERRAESLTLAEWACLARACAEKFQ